MKRLRVFLVVFFAALMLGIGTGITTVQAYRLPEQNYLALGVSLLVRGQGSAVANPLDAKTVARIESGSLTLREITPLKKVLQESINRGFKKWQVQRSGILMRDYGALIGSKPDNETARNMLFTFLSESPAYRDQFRLYDRLLSREIELKIENITRQVHEAFKNINLIIDEGRLIREWNTTVTINGENCTAINRVYELEINGTVLTFVKVSIYSPDGVEIADPYGMLVANTLVYYTWYLWWPPGSWWPIWIYGPVVYGMDYLAYTRFPGEPSLEAQEYYCWVAGVLYQQHGSLEAIFQGFASLAVNIIYTQWGNPYALALAVVLASIARAGDYISDRWYEDRWDAFSSMFMYNYEQDPSFGFEIMQRFHLVNSPQAWDPLSFTTLHWVNVEGVVVQICPDPGLVMYVTSAYDVSVFHDCCVLFASHYGTNNWVWVGAWEPPG